MQPLSREVIDKGFRLLRIRVDVSQLMLQIADKVHTRLVLLQFAALVNVRCD
jgi:hypothetical protein